MTRERLTHAPNESPQVTDGERPAQFGRTATARSGDLTDLGCPDCTGVLALQRLDGYMSFTCSIGHSFSPERLVRAKEEQLETALWSAVELYGELILIHRELSADSRAEGEEALAAAREQRAARAESLVARLKELIGDDDVAPEKEASE